MLPLLLVFVVIVAAVEIGAVIFTLAAVVVISLFQ